MVLPLGLFGATGVSDGAPQTLQRRRRPAIR
ncbi:hypothetical protein M878_33610 [Streptomyces roseochromogenus subsp. oscitans DS 12.976]|uniref:Uncharacterized protein n=1 Tax=Streptomyces roseochromogenus subsp. oscitans DS 12.976 TaxID=1352936 RepID=V6JTT1_STRRC|nr:hypothetical protein M878_33610 [Streptomyces roseochromogenus subsp. oscitans DS 12.976]